jgi:hypothetical protein
LVLDQRSISRPQGAACDVGAVEVEQSIEPQPQSIAFSAPASGSLGGSYTPTATATSGLPVTFAIAGGSTPGACTLSSGTVTFTGIGHCVVAADQAGSAEWEPAPQVTATTTVAAAFTGFSSPLPKTKLAKKTATIPVKFTLGNLQRTIAVSSADTEVRISTLPHGGGTVLGNAPCAWKATVSAFQCQLKTPKSVQTGLTYYLTVFQRVPPITGTWFELADAIGVAAGNSQPVAFK